MYLLQIAVQIEQQCVSRKCISSKREHELLREQAIQPADYQNIFQESSGPHNLQIGPSSLSTRKKSNIVN